MSGSGEFRIEIGPFAAREFAEQMSELVTGPNGEGVTSHTIRIVALRDSCGECAAPLQRRDGFPGSPRCWHCGRYLDWWVRYQDDRPGIYAYEGNEAPEDRAILGPSIGVTSWPSGRAP
jgi:hypothetical protein